MKFDVIVADPPYGFKDSLKMSDVARGAQANYATMTISEIKQLDVASLCSPSGAVLCLWVPGSMLQEGLDIMKAWQFTHKQVYVWAKTKKEPLGNLRSHIKKFMTAAWKIADPKYLFSLKDYLEGLNGSLELFGLTQLLTFGMGRLFRQSHEICLIGISNNGVYKKLRNKSQRSVSFAENLKHSSKPETLQDSLELMFPDSNFFEMFARRQRPGWTCVGNEIDGTDIRDALATLK